MSSMLSLVMKLWKHLGGNDFVKKSASWALVWTGSNLNMPFWILSRTKWKSISRCYVLSWNTGLVAICIAFWLSQYKVRSFVVSVWRSLSKPIIHCNSHDANDNSQYSALDEFLEIVCCFLARHETNKVTRKKQ